jgi:hypothetical protein
MIALCLAAATCSLASPGLAQDPVTSTALFHEGREAMKRHDYAGACAKFAESHRLDPAPGTLLNLGECKEQLGRVASAWQHYQEAADLLPEGERLDLAKQRLAALQPRLSRLTIRLAAGAPAGASVSRDDVALGSASLDVALPVDPGVHRIVVTAPGRRAKSFSVELAEAQGKTLVVEPGLPEPALPPAAASKSAQTPGAIDPGAPRTSSRTIGLVVGGVGLVAVAVGAVTGIMTIERKNLVDDNCHDQVCNPEGVAAASEGRTFSIVSTATFAAGIVGLGVGAYLILSSGPASSGATAVGPAMGPGGAGLKLVRSF